MRACELNTPYARSDPKPLAHVGLIDRWIDETRPVELNASGPGEFPRLKAFLAEDRTPLCWFEGHRRLLTAGRARGHRFHPLAGHRAARGTTGPLTLTGFAPLGFIFEVLVGEKLLLARRPHELRAAVHARKDPVL